MKTVFTPRLIVGLGNPGIEYAETRHNVGFAVIDSLISKSSRSADYTNIAESDVFTLTAAGNKIITFVKPRTFMNASGLAVLKLQRKLELLPQEIMIVYDCLDIPFGKIRLRRNGSSGGHRGVESVIREVQSADFSRLRIGIGRPENGHETVDYVLSEWHNEEHEPLKKVVETAAEAVLMTIRCGIDHSMNYYNNRSIFPENTDTGSESQKKSKESQD